MNCCLFLSLGVNTLGSESEEEKLLYFCVFFSFPLHRPPPHVLSCPSDIKLYLPYVKPDERLHRLHVPIYTATFSFLSCQVLPHRHLRWFADASGQVFWVCTDQDRDCPLLLPPFHQSSPCGALTEFTTSSEGEQWCWCMRHKENTGTSKVDMINIALWDHCLDKNPQCCQLRRKKSSYWPS